MSIEKLFSKQQFQACVSGATSANYDSFATMPMPSSKTEDWKYSDLSTINFSSFSTLSSFEPKFLGENCAKTKSSPPNWQPSDKLEAAIKTFSFFSTRAKASGKANLQATFSPAASAVCTNVIELSNDCTLDYYEDYSCLPQQSFFGCKTLFLLGEGSTINYYSLQRFGEGVFSLINKEFHLGSGATANVIQAELGASFSRVKLQQHFDGDGSSAPVNKAVFFGSGSQHFDLTTDAFHHAKGTRSDIVVKGALKGKATSVYRGLIKIDKTASGTDSFLQDRVLHLSKGVASNSIPSLKIDNNDVRASHGATISKLNEESLFYLSSRGLQRPTAERLVVEGFVNDVVCGIPKEKITETIDDIIEEKLA